LGRDQRGGGDRVLPDAHGREETEECREWHVELGVVFKDVKNAEPFGEDELLVVLTKVG
jgi:hypothetical protein